MALYASSSDLMRRHIGSHVIVCPSLDINHFRVLCHWWELVTFSRLLLCSTYCLSFSLMEHLSSRQCHNRYVFELVQMQITQIASSRCIVLSSYFWSKIFAHRNNSYSHEHINILVLIYSRLYHSMARASHRTTSCAYSSCTMQNRDKIARIS